MARRAALLLLVVLGCARAPTTSAPPEPEEEPLAAVRRSRSKPRRPAPPPAITQAIAELERNPDLHVLVVGARAHPVRKAMLRAARGRIDDDRIRVAEPDPAEPPARDVEFRFFVPPVPAPDEGGMRSFHTYIPQ